MLAWVVSSATVARAQPKPSAAAVKAQFVERFTRFIEWPESVLERKRFTLCVAGDGATARALRSFVANHEIKQRPAALREVSANDDLSGCWVLFICSDSQATAPALLAKLDGKPVLTIGDSAALSDAGVMMSFYRHGRRVRFSIDPQRITDAGLKARSKLLRLGRTARRGE